MSAVTHTFEQELRTYSAERERLLSQAEGKFVVIRGEQVAGEWASYEDALREGYRMFKLDPFLVKRVQAVDSVVRLSRDLGSCPS